MLFGNLSLGLALLSALFSAVFFLLGAEETTEDLLILNVSKRPLINLYWLGTILILLGIIIAPIALLKKLQLMISNDFFYTRWVKTYLGNIIHSFPPHEGLLYC